MMLLKVNRQEIKDPELALQIYSMRKRVRVSVSPTQRPLSLYSSIDITQLTSFGDLPVCWSVMGIAETAICMDSVICLSRGWFMGEIIGLAGWSGLSW